MYELMTVFGAEIPYYYSCSFCWVT